MVTVTTALVERAERIFSDLGYAVSIEGTRLRAERKWRTVHVTPASETTTPNAGDFQCFLAEADEADDVLRRLAADDSDGEWAVLGIADDGDYEVHHPSDPVLA